MQVSKTYFKKQQAIQFVCLGILVLPLAAFAEGRVKLNLNPVWRFHLGALEAEPTTAILETAALPLSYGSFRCAADF